MPDMLNQDTLKAMATVLDEMQGLAGEFQQLLSRLDDSRDAYEFKCAVGSAVGQVAHAHRRVQKELSRHGHS